MPYAPDSAPTPNSVRLSLCVTSGAKTASHALFPPHVSHQENHNLPYTALCGTFPFSSSITSGAKSVSHALFPPHVSHQEMKAQKTPPEIALEDFRRPEAQKQGVKIALWAERTVKSAKTGVKIALWAEKQAKAQKSAESTHVRVPQKADCTHKAGLFGLHPRMAGWCPIP